MKIKSTKINNSKIFRLHFNRIYNDYKNGKYLKTILGELQTEGILDMSYQLFARLFRIEFEKYTQNNKPI